MRKLFKSEIKILFKFIFNIIGKNLKYFVEKIRNEFFLRIMGKKIFMFDKKLLEKNTKYIDIITLGVFIGKINAKKHIKNIKINYFCLNLFTPSSLNKAWIKKSSLGNVLSRFKIYEKDIAIISKVNVKLPFVIVYSEEGLLLGCGFITIKNYKKGLIKLNSIDLFCHV